MKKKNDNIIFLLIISLWTFSSCSNLKEQPHQKYDMTTMEIFPEPNKVIERKVHRLLKKDKDEYPRYLYHAVSLKIYCDTIDGRILEVEDSDLPLIDSKFIPFHEIAKNYIKQFSNVKIQSGALKGQKWRKRGEYLVIFWLKDKNKLEFSTAISW